MKEAYQDQIKRELTKSCKAKNAERYHYYSLALSGVAVVSFETFKGSWAYERWREREAAAIKEIEKEQNRLFFLV